MKARIVFAVESPILSSQLTLKPELCKVGHSAKQPHLTNEETKAQRGDGSSRVTPAVAEGGPEAELLARAVFSEVCSLFDKRVVQKC